MADELKELREEVKKILKSYQHDQGMLVAIIQDIQAKYKYPDVSNRFLIVCTCLSCNETVSSNDRNKKMKLNKIHRAYLFPILLCVIPITKSNILDTIMINVEKNDGTLRF